jgi:hypothetical protein
MNTKISIAIGADHRFFEGLYNQRLWNLQY